MIFKIDRTRSLVTIKTKQLKIIIDKYGIELPARVLSFSEIIIIALE